MYRHDLPVSQDVNRAVRFCAFTETHTDADERAHCHMNLHVSLETQGKEKCKFSPLQVCDLTSSGRWAFECEHVEEMVKRGIQEGRWHRFANSLCPHVLFSPLFFDERTQLLCCNSGWKSLRRMWQQLPFLHLFSLFSFHPFLSIPWLKNMLCSIFPPFCHPHFWVPPRSSCLVRLQVVWQQDLQKRTCASNTLTEPQCNTPLFFF